MRFLNLAKKNREVQPTSWDDLYGTLVAREFRKIYSNDKCEAIINNYLDDPTNEKYVAEFKAMQDYRKYCKNFAKKEMGEY
jgi:hypothetical protein